ncbi:D-2-hydroxyacid dehydrogenase [Sporosarcina sp. P26b]|uniref:D-2-hydroxyacid dehydrogenase n=1 Tax=unclassified Sporosarcina TaxID=2647733 RepID=UPI000C16F5CD|nr:MULTISPECIES: D-2-hydroxyacid dehydrogenase [unclassified Sporosarcina]PIC72359.1 D-2-hydroxyacid dehydrogenase [Sporosarcina sp. P17b]PIC94541.1 D-2-hydroxyacid dehydrogenase [Sporosarcina sp. P26b]
MKVLFTFKIKTTFKEQLKEKYPNVEFIYTTNIDDASLEDIEVIVTDGGDLTSEHVEKATALKWVMVAAVGVDTLPIEALQERDILVTNSHGVHKMPLAESVLAHLLSLERGLPGIYKREDKKEWKLDSLPGEMNHSTALIVGTGAIGGEIGRLLQAFHVRTIGCNRSGHSNPSMDETISFQEILERLPEADYVISILPSTPQTRWIYQPEHFRAMKETAVFMNVGRGDAVKEQYVLVALQQNEIRHAVLDVFETEPLPEDHPFWELPNCTVSPHMSSLSDQYIKRSLDIMDTNLDKWVAGEKDLINQVDLAKGY